MLCWDLQCLLRVYRLEPWLPSGGIRWNLLRGCNGGKLDPRGWRAGEGIGVLPPLLSLLLPVSQWCYYTSSSTHSPIMLCSHECGNSCLRFRSFLKHQQNNWTPRDKEVKTWKGWKLAFIEPESKGEEYPEGTILKLADCQVISELVPRDIPFIVPCSPLNISPGRTEITPNTWPCLMEGFDGWLWWIVGLVY